jgi:nucleotidyltransferase substrate binding protein (TIGR01987 family)
MADQNQALQNLERALGELESYAALPILHNRDKAGLIQAFEFTFELFWKCFQKLAPEAGLEAASPREALQAGVKLHLIAADEIDDWSQMLRDRNLTSHSYNVAVADGILARLLARYLPRFRATHARLREPVSAAGVLVPRPT